MTLYTGHTDEELLGLLRADNEAAFTELYNRYWKFLYALAVSKLKVFSEAEDLVQDIFVDLWKRRMDIHLSSPNLKGYLAVATRYKVIRALANRRRKEAHRQTSPQTTLTDHSTEEFLRAEELKDQLYGLTTTLPEKCRLVFQLSRYAYLNNKEIARELGISEKTVEMHLSKALRALRTGLGIFFLLLELLILLWTRHG
jgi:RNA polymerase sigma-70 factor (family 1)